MSEELPKYGYGVGRMPYRADDEKAERRRLLVTLAGHVWEAYFAKYGDDTAPDDVVSDAEDILAAIERLEAGHE